MEMSPPMSPIPPGHGIGVARGQVRIARVGADLGQDAPGARAFATLGAQGLDGHAGDIG